MKTFFALTDQMTISGRFIVNAISVIYKIKLNVCVCVCTSIRWKEIEDT